MKRIIVFAMMAIISTLCSSAFAYLNVVNLGTLPANKSYSCAYSVNDNGQIAGYAAKEDRRNQYACLFDSSGSGNNIDMGGGTARSINNSGQVVGDSAQYQEAYLYDTSGQGNNISLASNQGPISHTMAVSINNAGLIAGFNNGYHYLYDSSTGNSVTLGISSGYTSYINGAINDNGLLVGQTEVSDNVRKAFLYDTTGQANAIILGTTAGGSESMAYSINNNGQIVGWDADNIGHRRACLFDPTGNGNNIQLGDGEAAAINDNGQIVGYSNSHAFLFDSTGNGNNIDLNSLIDPACGWTLTNAFDINNNGWIVGQGIYRDINGFEIGDQRAFLLIIPEPATLILLSLGGLLLRKSRS